MWLLARTNSKANDKEITELRTSECTSQQSKEHNKQNEKVKKTSLDVKKISVLIGRNKIKKIKVEENKIN